MSDELRRATAHGVGMPAFIRLHQFGRMVQHAFGIAPILVGSAVSFESEHTEANRHPTDIDVRLVIGDFTRYKDIIGLPLYDTHLDSARVAFSLAFSLAGKELTGLPIDFQIQGTHWARKYEGRPYLILDGIGI